jgi:hypothetical protein
VQDAAFACWQKQLRHIQDTVEHPNCGQRIIILPNKTVDDTGKDCQIPPI